jgi:hypothetical protein
VVEIRLKGNNAICKANRRVCGAGDKGVERKLGAMKAGTKKKKIWILKMKNDSASGGDEIKEAYQNVKQTSALGAGAKEQKSSFL